jgi:ribonucleoside-diphosphate reductase alpha chain
VGYVRGNVHRIGVVRTAAAARVMEAPDPDLAHDIAHEHAHLHDEDLGGLIGPSFETVDLSEIAASVEASVAAVARDIANPVGMQVAALETRLNTGPHDLHVKRAEAKMKGYEGDACGTCGNFTLVRNGTCMKCNTCGSTSGCS